MARKQKEHHYIYKTTCSVSGRYYIGMHSTDNMNDGYLGSGKRLWNSIKYHGRENHKIEILEHYDNREVLRKREAELVTEDLMNDPMCMNLVVGGEGFTSEYGKRANTNLNKKLATDAVFKKEFGNKISSAQKKLFDAGLRDKNWGGIRFGGKKHSEETLELMRSSKKGHGAGETNSQYGTCWVTKDGVNKKIKKLEFENFIQDGWVKGRV